MPVDSLSMLQRAPIITLFPYTTLFRSALFGIMLSVVDKKPTIRQLYQIAELGKAQGEPTRAPTFMRLTVPPGQPRIEGARSEEHTSELQSLTNLVCRLLLEKKNQ